MREDLYTNLTVRRKALAKAIVQDTKTYDALVAMEELKDQYIASVNIFNGYLAQLANTYRDKNSDVVIRYPNGDFDFSRMEHDAADLLQDLIERNRGVIGNLAHATGGYGVVINNARAWYKERDEYLQKQEELEEEELEEEEERRAELEDLERLAQVSRAELEDLERLAQVSRAELEALHRLPSGVDKNVSLNNFRKVQKVLTHEEYLSFLKGNKVQITDEQLQQIVALGVVENTPQVQEHNTFTSSMGYAPETPSGTATATKSVKAWDDPSVPFFKAPEVKEPVVTVNTPNITYQTILDLQQKLDELFSPNAQRSLITGLGINPSDFNILTPPFPYMAVQNTPPQDSDPGDEDEEEDEEYEEEYLVCTGDPEDCPLCGTGTYGLTSGPKKGEVDTSDFTEAPLPEIPPTIKEFVSWLFGDAPKVQESSTPSLDQSSKNEVSYIEVPRGFPDFGSSDWSW